MKRPDGLDKSGQPMTVKGGIVDALSLIQTGKMLMAYSGGLHHILAPGERRLRIFKKISIKFEIVDIPGYLASFTDQGTINSKAIQADLEGRRDRYCV